MRKTSRSLVLILAAIALVLQPALGQSKGFLKIQGIGGESSDQHHQDWIDVQSIAWGGKNPAAGVPRSGSQSKGPGSLVIVKRVDKASPLLRSKSGGGQTFPEVVLEISGTGPDGKPGVYIYKMTDVTIASVKPGGAGSAAFQESVTLNYQKISWTYTPQK
jgi:type VI secretion system secreted protein Hcp